MVALAGVPPVVGPAAQHVDLLPRLLADVVHPDLAGPGPHRHAERVAEARGPGLQARPGARRGPARRGAATRPGRADERVAGRHRTGAGQAQHLAEREVGAARVVVVAGAAAGVVEAAVPVADGHVQQAVGPERQVTRVVGGERRDAVGQHPLGGRQRAVAGQGEARDAVEWQPGARHGRAARADPPRPEHVDPRVRGEGGVDRHAEQAALAVGAGAGGEVERGSGDEGAARTQHPQLPALGGHQAPAVRGEGQSRGRRHVRHQPGGEARRQGRGLRRHRRQQDRDEDQQHGSQGRSGRTAHHEVSRRVPELHVGPARHAQPGTSAAAGGGSRRTCGRRSSPAAVGRRR